jgi:DNA modification methylase
MDVPWGQVWYYDCMNKRYGLGKWPDKTFGIGVADPPFNVNFGVKPLVKGKKRINPIKNSILYSDNMTPQEYEAWCLSWFTELVRVCKIVVIYCGYSNDNMWLNFQESMWQKLISEYEWHQWVLKHPNKDPIEFRQKYPQRAYHVGLIEEIPDNEPISTYYRGKAYHVIDNPKSGSSIAYLNCVRPILIYGKLATRLKRDIFFYSAKWGFIPHEEYDHPCPMDIDFWDDFIGQITAGKNPKTIIDIFLGSGATAEASERRGLDWFGYEIDQKYQPVIETRREHGINYRKYDAKSRNQSHIEGFFGLQHNPISSIVLPNQREKNKEKAELLPQKRKKKKQKNAKKQTMTGQTQLSFQ